MDLKQKSLRILYPSEVFVAIYIIVTGIVIILFSAKLSEPIKHLTIRIIFLLIIYFLTIQKLNLLNFFRNIRPFVPFLFLAYFYNETDYLNNLIFKNNLDNYISAAEFKIFSNQPSLFFSQIIPNNWFAESMYFGYFSYYILIISIPAYLFFYINRTTGIKSISILISSFLIYYCLFILIPVSGPQFYFQDILNPLPVGYIFGSGIRLIQSLGEAPTAAFPSSHISICCILLWLCFVYNKKLLLICIPVAILLFFSTVYLRAHYVIDVIAGILFSPVVYKTSLLLCNQLNNIYFSHFRIKNEL